MILWRINILGKKKIITYFYHGDDQLTREETQIIFKSFDVKLWLNLKIHKDAQNKQNS